MALCYAMRQSVVSRVLRSDGLLSPPFFFPFSFLSYFGHPTLLITKTITPHRDRLHHHVVRFSTCFAMQPCRGSQQHRRDKWYSKWNQLFCDSRREHIGSLDGNLLRRLHGPSYRCLLAVVRNRPGHYRPYTDGGALPPQVRPGFYGLLDRQQPRPQHRYRNPGILCASD